MNNKGEEKSQNNSNSSQDAENAAKFLKTLANPNRLIILNLLMNNESCVGDLEKSLNISQSALSQHLSRMRDDGILARRRESQQIFYTIKDERIKKYLKLTQEVFYS
ncbi:MAG: winged helix-turn-helix transcriptional regulator [Kordiimonadaceae bacterium]|nr:winged helix-turn-helix transcriptional regulator [Kordiimonadaceae bacterium]MBT6329206.1 winged helix-turn-helix transcriptional regulator [Kordiimonadaceae bacterium]MBT7583274.1 winged helix-turn-helix transcriptional regulator [Kordiimonadaceae bacterium]